MVGKGQESLNIDVHSVNIFSFVFLDHDYRLKMFHCSYSTVPECFLNVFILPFLYVPKVHGFLYNFWTNNFHQKYFLFYFNLLKIFSAVSKLLKNSVNLLAQFNQKFSKSLSVFLFSNNGLVVKLKILLV